jgi:hypothetical protein
MILNLAQNITVNETLSELHVSMPEHHPQTQLQCIGLYLT